MSGLAFPFGSSSLYSLLYLTLPLLLVWVRRTLGKTLVGFEQMNEAIKQQAEMRVARAA